MLFYCRYGGKKANQDQGQDTCSHPKEATIRFFKFHVVSPHGLVITGGVEPQQDQDRDVH